MNKRAYRAVVFRVVIAAPLLAMGLASPAWGQTGTYTLNGGSANLLSITTNTSTANQSGILVYGSGILAVGTVNVTTSGSFSSSGDDNYGIDAGILTDTSNSVGTIRITGSSNSVVTTGSIANGLFASNSLSGTPTFTYSAPSGSGQTAVFSTNTAKVITVTISAPASVPTGLSATAGDAQVILGPGHELGDGDRLGYQQPNRGPDRHHQRQCILPAGSPVMRST